MQTQGYLYKTMSCKVSSHVTPKLIPAASAIPSLQAYVLHLWASPLALRPDP